MRRSLIEINAPESEKLECRDGPVVKLVTPSNTMVAYRVPFLEHRTCEWKFHAGNLLDHSR
jgi:hypothetical protein